MQIDRAWIEVQVKKLNGLLGRDPAGARPQIQKHVEDLRIAPVPEMGERLVQVTGRATLDGLLGSEEVVRLRLVAGAGFKRATFGL